ncbi:MAG TPA: hypothetical protein VE954_27895 [Oligoflexus sp.]|uniref:hypothetical protein n=1 Tax=Oligoflexus sp. TaxID=1971216 RepID=UPI002D662F25|nr:hypothetical protein [Oligoflexus sp.]HYX36946.1 hypothetical protein [Oligoflexus sp.]
MTTFSSISILVFCSVLAACSGSEFKTGSTPSGDGPAAPETETVTPEEIGSTADQAPSTTDPSDPAAPAPTVTPLVKAEDKTALDECTRQWGKTPFTPQELAAPKLVEINEDVANNAVIFTDDKITAKDTLFLVNFNISVGNNGQLAFMNPKGWYCFNVKAKVINNFVINAACDAHVAIVSKQAQNDKNFMIVRQQPCPAVP